MGVTTSVVKFIMLFFYIINCLSDQRVRDVQFLEKELELTLEETIGETDNLITLKSRVLKALEACSDPMKVTLLCLEER